MRMDIIPYAGLCNRMRVIASGYACALELGYSARVHWTYGRAECKARFDDLFDVPELPSFDLEESNCLLFHQDSRMNLHLPSLLRKVAYSHVIRDYNFRETPGRMSLSDRIRKDAMSGNIALCSMHQCGPNYPLGTLFRPRSDIQERIQALVPEGAGADMVGIHIRRTDHVIAIKYASTDAYASAMQEEIDRNPACRFYLATDDATVKELLIRRFGQERIVTGDLVLCRDAREGMVGAVIDLFCLSRTSKVIGSFRSSYSEIAAELGGIPLQMP